MWCGSWDMSRVMLLSIESLRFGGFVGCELDLSALFSNKKSSNFWPKSIKYLLEHSCWKAQVLAVVGFVGSNRDQSLPHSRTVSLLPLLSENIYRYTEKKTRGPDPQNIVFSQVSLGGKLGDHFALFAFSTYCFFCCLNNVEKKNKTAKVSHCTI